MQAAQEEVSPQGQEGEPYTIFAGMFCFFNADIQLLQFKVVALSMMVALASPVLKQRQRHDNEKKVVMMMQAMYCGKQSQAAPHTQANDSMPVPTGAATRGELLGSSNKEAFGTPVPPAIGTRQRRRRKHNPVPVMQYSAHAAQVWATVCLLAFQVVLALHMLCAMLSLAMFHLWAVCMLFTSC